MNAPAPAISVITIVKNGENHLPRAMDSVLAQSFSNYEYIIINDGSTDTTAAIIEAHQDNSKQIIARHLDENIGRAMARNMGIEVSSGQYLLFLDADDYLAQKALKLLHDAAEKYGSDIVYGGTQAFDAGSGEPRDWHYTDQFVDITRTDIRLEDHLPLVRNHQITGRLYRRSYLDENRIRFSTQRRNAEDVLFAFYTAYHAQRISMIPTPVVYFYGVGNLLGSANESKIFDARDNVLETLTYARMHGSRELQKSMWVKAANFAASWNRARKVYCDDEAAFWNFVFSLASLVEEMPDEAMEQLSPFECAICIILAKPRSEESRRLLSWLEQKQESLDRLHNLKVDLERELGNLKNSLSIRWATSLRALGGKLPFDGVRRPADQHDSLPVPSLTEPEYSEISDTLGVELNELHRKIMETVASISKLQREIMAMKESWSWRLTAPARWLLSSKR